jgi:hypothetical protein
VKQTSPPTPEEIEDRLYSLRPLRWYLTLWVAMLYVWALPFWKYSPSSLALFTALMLAHGLGHWFSLSLSRPRCRLWLYCAVGLMNVARHARASQVWVEVVSQRNLTQHHSRGGAGRDVAQA